MSERCYVCGRPGTTLYVSPFNFDDNIFDDDIHLCRECFDRWLEVADYPVGDHLREWLSKQTFYKDRVLLEDLSVGMWYWFHSPLLLPNLEIVVDMLSDTPHWIKVQFVSIKGVNDDGIFKVSTYGRGLVPPPVASGGEWGEWGKGKWCQRYSSTLMPEDKPGDKTGAKSVAKSGCKLGKLG